MKSAEEKSRIRIHIQIRIRNPVYGSISKRHGSGTLDKRALLYLRIRVISQHPLPLIRVDGLEAVLAPAQNVPHVPVLLLARLCEQLP